ncbi:MAG: hypothetical protein AAGA17_18185 [Actinomycetota bacterium]
MSLISPWRALTAVLVVALVALAAPPRSAAQDEPRIVLDEDASWLEVVNHHREAAGLSPVVDEPGWIDGLTEHLDYLRLTPERFLVGAYLNPHRQNPESPFATAAGTDAARSTNIGYGDTDREAIESWLRAPFHAIGLLRPGWQRTAFTRDLETGRALLDVVRGIDVDVEDRVVLFPADGVTTRLRDFDGELPDPLESCPGFTEPSGLPIIALLPGPPTPGTTASVTLPDGRVLTPGPDLCIVTADTYRSTDAVHGETGRRILDGANAVLVIPRLPLADGQHTVALSVPGVDSPTWSFGVAGVDSRAVVGGAAAPGWAGTEGYLLVDSLGSVTAFGGAPAGRPTTEATEATDVAATPAGTGYWVLRADGRVEAHGTAPDLGGAGTLRAGERATALSPTPAGDGYWIFTSTGRAVPVGTATFLGDLSDVALNGPVLDAVATPSGLGYYLVASDGGVFAFGDAVFVGSMGGLPLNAPVRSLAPDPDGRGYWLVASDGGVFAFEAPFVGSMGGRPLNAPMVGIVSRGDGYTTVASDGGVFSFGAPFLGSLGASGSARPIVAISPVG